MNKMIEMEEKMYGWTESRWYNVRFEIDMPDTGAAAAAALQMSKFLEKKKKKFVLLSHFETMILQLNLEIGKPSFLDGYDLS